MKTTALNQKHKDIKAKMVEFAEFEMPISYGQIKDEYFAVRQACGMFDISHMAPIILQGKTEYLTSFLNRITCKEVTAISKGEVQYNAMINHQGGLVDDITIYYLNNDKFMVIANASNRDKVLDYMNAENKESVEIKPGENYILLAVQGPKAEETLYRLLQKKELSFNEIYYYECSELSNSSDEFTTVLSRTGYTGEDGFEVLLSTEDGLALFNSLLDAGTKPCGLAARDVLRLEVFYPLYGNELNAERTPYESGIGWLVSPDKEFNGKDIVIASKGNSNVRGFLMLEDGVPRKDYPIVTADDENIGSVTSGGFSFQWNKGFGMANLKKGYTKKDTEIFIEIRGQKKPARVYAKSPYQGSIKRRPE